MTFGIPADFKQRRRADGATFYCPSGHANVYRDSDVDRMRKKADAAERRAARAEAQATHAREQGETAERRRRATAGHLTRLKNRVRKGVCPFCNRHFANLQRHIDGQHPQPEET